MKFIALGPLFSTQSALDDVADVKMRSALPRMRTLRVQPSRYVLKALA